MRSPTHLLVVGLLALGCHASGSKASHENTNLFQVAEVATASDAEAKPYRLRPGLPGLDDPIRLKEPVTFAVVRAQATRDHLGYPAVTFELTRADKPRFEAWTADRVGRGVALLVGGEIQAVATVDEPLPGHGMISGGAYGFSKEEVEALIAQLTPGT